MTRVPTAGLFRDAQHRYYWNGEGPLPGVTGVIGVLDKPAVVAWAKRETARCAVDNHQFVEDMLARGGKPAAIEWLSRIPDYQRDTAADLGSAVHRHAESLAHGNALTVEPEHSAHVVAYQRFLADHRPTFVAVERMVANLTAGYGGTFDAIADIGGVRWLLDIKTSKGAYAETAMQLAAYANAEFIGDVGDPRRYAIPQIDRYGVVHIRPEQYARGYALIPYSVGQTEYDAFLACLTLTRWKAQRAASVKGEPVKATEELAA